MLYSGQVQHATITFCPGHLVAQRLPCHNQLLYLPRLPSLVLAPPASMRCNTAQDKHYENRWTRPDRQHHGHSAAGKDVLLQSPNTVHHSGCQETTCSYLHPE